MSDQTPLDTVQVVPEMSLHGLRNSAFLNSAENWQLRAESSMLRRIDTTDQIRAQFNELARNILLIPVHLVSNWHLSAYLLVLVQPDKIQWNTYYS